MSVTPDYDENYRAGFRRAMDWSVFGLRLQLSANVLLSLLLLWTASGPATTWISAGWLVGSACSSLMAVRFCRAMRDFD